VDRLRAVIETSSVSVNARGQVSVKVTLFGLETDANLPPVIVITEFNERFN
jgi:hypothetical protein